MGRYYQGDINGKFWFGVQDSDDASFFGGQEAEPRFIEYYFDKDEDYKTVCEGVKTCNTELGEYKSQLDTFFKKRDGYNDEMLAKYLKVKKSTARGLLEWYARLELGEKIKRCVEKKGSCSFIAEL